MNWAGKVLAIEEGDQSKCDFKSAWPIGSPWVCPMGEGDSGVLTSLGGNGCLCEVAMCLVHFI